MMTKKRKLSDLVREETARPEPETTEPAPIQPSETDEPEQFDLPKYLTLVRKETRLREDQLEQLTVLARRLNRQRRGGERITENTLIRIAIDLLLSQSKNVVGETEAELRKVLGLKTTE